ncbi:MAG TPA: thymidine phosphorylase [Conexibacter sp.]|jgi:thymidine phosphorylase|nr:thymidine phosphorylase [Conexibacter sp.]
MFQPQEVLRKKRDGQELTPDEVRRFVLGTATGEVTDAQIGAFTTSVCINGMTAAETEALTLAMRDSGTVVDWAAAGLDPRRVVEKHSSGGVGDEKTTVLVVPMVAAAGVTIPNLTERGLDYLAGEIDLLEALPGYVARPDTQTLVEILKTTGGAIVAPTSDLAPADGAIFKIRSTTATVESVALITGSILSKKLAVNPSGIVTSVGSGSGAFMQSRDDARELALMMSRVASGAGVPNVQLLADFDSVLGTCVGSGIEMLEVASFLSGGPRDPRVLDLVLSMSAEIIALAGLADDLDDARALALEQLESGKAADKLQQIVAAQGGPSGFMEDPARHIPEAPVRRALLPRKPGYVESMRAIEVGFALVQLGGGRSRPEDSIDYSVGFSDFTQLGQRVDEQHPLCVIHAADEDRWAVAAERVLDAVVVSDRPTAPAGPVVIERIAGAGRDGDER